jgi:hypothetical protein
VPSVRLWPRARSRFRSRLRRSCSWTDGTGLVGAGCRAKAGSGGSPAGLGNSTGRQRARNLPEFLEPPRACAPARTRPRGPITPALGSVRRRCPNSAKVSQRAPQTTYQACYQTSPRNSSASSPSSPRKLSNNSTGSGLGRSTSSSSRTINQRLLWSSSRCISIAPQSSSRGSEATISGLLHPVRRRSSGAVTPLPSGPSNESARAVPLRAFGSASSRERHSRCEGRQDD